MYGMKVLWYVNQSNFVYVVYVCNVRKRIDIILSKKRKTENGGSKRMQKLKSKQLTDKRPLKL